MNPYYDLLKSWCDRLIELQLTDTNEKIMTGGILCPSCAMIHGRIGDAVYPFVLLYDQTKYEKYLNAAYDKIDEKYGSMTKFLTETLGVDIQKMKQLYLY